MKDDKGHDAEPRDQLSGNSLSVDNSRAPDHARNGNGLGSSTPTGELRSIVGIGASAGGLEALKEFFAATPCGGGVAFVVVMHLDPSRRSMLDEILARVTRLNVCMAENGMALEPDRIYITPPGKEISVRAGHLSLEAPQYKEKLFRLIDNFLFSLAVDQGVNSIAVILSGTGADGSQGCKAVKEAGGTVIVQDDDSAAFPDMPRNVIAVGAANFVLPAEKIAKHIFEIVNPEIGTTLPISSGNMEEQLNTIFRIVRTKTGHDFSPYKMNTVVRRIDRRMAVRNITDINGYVALLEEDPLEASHLRQDMLIGVTSFFRDPEAFAILNSTVLPRMFEGRDPDDPVRIWHASCSTGEEVYSMALMIREFLDKFKINATVQFFATDIDETAIAHARAGIYPADIESELSREQLDNFFIKTDKGYRVAKALREMVIFAPHSLVKDPPFSRLDLLVCRNFLIYLKSDMQQRLISLFHLALKPGGFLFLGSSETIGRATDLFAPLDNAWKIYQRQQSDRRFEAAYPLNIAYTQLAGLNRPLRPSVDEAPPGVRAEKMLMERYSPPCVVVNDKYEVVYVSTRLNRFLEVPVGEPTKDLLKMARKELRPALRSAIHKAITEQKQVVFRELKIIDDRKESSVDILVEPMDVLPPASKLVMVVFEQTKDRANLPSPSGKTIVGIPAEETAKDMLIRQLEEQLYISHEQLQATIEQLESSNEGLMSSNEELLSINEEYQSTNEELHSTNEELETSREELQALNEELVTLNAELQQNVEELNQANSDMDNLLNSSEIATIFLDCKLRIKRFTPAMAELFNLIPADIDRPFHHLAGKVDWPGLDQDVEEVLSNQRYYEREVATLKGSRHFLARVLPYRTGEGKMNGVVVTLFDITERKRLEARTVHLASFPKINPNPVMELDLAGNITFFNPAITSILAKLGLDGQNATPFLPSDLGELIRKWDRKTEGTLYREVNILDKVFAETVHLAPQFNVVRIYAYDITERKHADIALRTSEERYRGLFDNMLEGFAFCKMVFENGKPRDFVYLSVNNAFETLTGLKDVTGKLVSEVIPGIREADPELFDIYARVALTGNPERFEKFVEALKMWFSISVYSPEKEYFVAIFDVITGRKRSEEALREREEIYSAIVNNAADGIVLVDPDTLQFVEFNDAACASLGYSRDEFASKTLKDIHDPITAEKIAATIRNSSQDHSRYQHDHRHLHKSGELRDVQISSEFVTVRGKTYLASVWHDITDRKRAEDEREKADRLESLGLLAGGIAHDFNNILTAVIGNISLARLKIGDNNPAADQLGDCERALDKATDLTRQLLTFSRGGEPVKKAVDVKQLISEVISFALHGSACKSELQIPPDLWLLDADNGQIHQAINNLIINALQAMPNGGTVTVSADNAEIGNENPLGLPAGRYVRISVSDQGCGISPEILPRIFDPYFTTKRTGTGIGLASVFSIVRRHGGCIEVSSQPGKGTTFTILLPAIDEIHSETAALSNGLGNLPSAQPGMSVLVMDDDEMIRSLTAAMLNRLGYTARTCSDGAEAVDIYRESLESNNRFSAVILDMTIPGAMGGKEAALNILAIDPNAVLIISSGYSVDTTYGGTKDPVFRGVVAKPYNISQLAQELARLTYPDGYK